MPGDTATLAAGDRPNTKYFSGGSLSPAYKNFNHGKSDNAMAVITVIPEPATMGLLALGGLALLRRRRKATCYD